MRLMPILPYLDHTPTIGDGVHLAENAFLVGMVQVRGPAMFQARAVARGDQNYITIGPHFHLGEGSTIHVERHTATLIGANVWVGDDAVIHATTLGDGTRVEDGGLVLSTSKVGAGSI